MLLQITPRTTKKSESEIVVGIDLGTTHSLVAYKDLDGQTQFIKFGGSSHLLPSAVTYGNDQQLVGYDALNSPLASGILASTKRLINDPNQYIYAKKTPVDVARDILFYMKQQAENQLNTKIKKCVITVPAYFDDTARNATKLAAELCDLEVLRVINEPTAAALAYGIDNAAEGIYAIYDLGGGTFDLSVLRMSKGVFQVLSTKGDTELGGDDIDNEIIRYWIKKYGADNIYNYKKFAKRFKETLSSSSIAIEDNISLTQEELVEICHPLISRTLELTQDALDDAQVSLNDIKGIVLVGGSTNLYSLKNKLKNTFNVTIYDNLNPDEVVAKGAAIQAHQLVYGGDHILLDVNALSLGLETMGGIVEKIIHRNTPIPAQIKQTFTTYQDNQTAIKFHIVQGERELAKDCRSLGEFILSGLPSMRSGALIVDVIFHLDVDGILTVKASYENNEISIQVKPSYGLDRATVQKMIYDANLHAQEDISNRLRLKNEVEASKIIEVAEMSIDDPLAEFSANEIITIKILIDRLKSSENLEDTIKEISDKLQPGILKRIQAGLKKRVTTIKI